MTPSTDAILHAALALPPDNRAALAEKLLESLDDEGRAEIDAAWAEEAEKRIRAFREGKTKATPADEVMRSLREKK